MSTFIDFRKQKPDREGMYLVIIANLKDDAIFTMVYEPDMEEGEQWGYWHDRYDSDTLGFIDSDWEPWVGEPVIGWMPVPDYSELEECEEDESTSGYIPKRVGGACFHGEIWSNCPHCGQSYESHDLDFHGIKSKYNEGVFFCKVCGKPFR